MPPQPLVHRRLPIRSLRAERLVVCRTCPVTLFLAPPLLQIKPVEIVNAHRSTATGVAQLLVRATYDPRRETQREPSAGRRCPPYAVSPWSIIRGVINASPQWGGSFSEFKRTSFTLWPVRIASLTCGAKSAFRLKSKKRTHARIGLAHHLGGSCPYHQVGRTMRTPSGSRRRGRRILPTPGVCL